MLTKDFKERIWEECSTSQQVQCYVNRAKASGLMNNRNKWLGKTIEQTLFLILLMQKCFDYNHSYEDEMPFFELGRLFIRSKERKEWTDFARRMTANKQVLLNTDSDIRKERYSAIYTLFSKNTS